MRILVTGGTGFTGSALVFKLLELKHEVYTIDYQKGIFYDELIKQGADVTIGSIVDKDLVNNLAKDIDIVFHVAAAFRELDVADEHYYDVNVNGTRYVLEAAQNNDVKKVIYCSTQGVHGNITSPPGSEDSPIAPEDYYQQTKYEGELVVHEFIKQGMLATILRPTAIYGPGDPQRFFMIYKRIKKGSFPMFGNGKTYYHPLYIDNLVNAFICAMDLYKGNGETYIIADEEYVEIRFLVERIASAMESPIKINNYPLTPLIIAGHICEKICKPFKITPPIFPRRVDWYSQVRAFDISKAKNDLGYEPSIGLDEGLKNTGIWYKEKGYL